MNYEFFSRKYSLFVSYTALVLLCLLPGWVTGQAEVFVNKLSGSPITAGQTFLLEDDKLTLPTKTAAMDKLFRLENRLVWSLYPNEKQAIPAGEYRMLVEIRYWKDKDNFTGKAPNSFLQELVIQVDSLNKKMPQVSHLFSQARKLEVEVKRVTLKGGPLPKDAPKMQLIGEVSASRLTCDLDLSQTDLSNDFFSNPNDNPSYNREVPNDNIVATVSGGVNSNTDDCADEYDFEYVFYDLDSKIGQILTGAIPEGDLLIDPLFRNNATRLTSKGPQFRLYNFFREGYILCRYRMVQYDPDTGERGFTLWSTHGTSLREDGTNYPGSHRVDHQKQFNWQATLHFAEEAKQLPAISYMDGTLRPRQSMTMNFRGNNGGPDPTAEFAISQQMLYDAMGRQVATVLPTPIYRPEGANTPSPLRLSTSTFATNATGDVYGRDELEQESCDLPPMGTDAGAGQFYSPENPEIDENAYVPDAEGYPFAITRFTPDNTGRVAQQGGVGRTLRLGNNHDTRYFYGKPNQWEIDRLFGVNVGLASHYEKNMVIDPNGQASVSYLDAKGRTVATALAGAPPNNLSALKEYEDKVSGDNTVAVKVDILENIVTDDRLVSTYSLLVPEDATYDICYAMAGADYCAESCTAPDGTELVDPACVSCRYDVRISISPTSCEALNADSEVEGSVLIELNDITASGMLSECLRNSETFDLSQLQLVAGEYLIEKTIILNEEGVRGAVEAFTASESTCLLSEVTFIAEYVSKVTLPTCLDCDCATPFEGLTDGCKNFCERITPCKALRSLMGSDLTPGGQYATFGFDQALGEYVAPDPAAISIFSTLTGASEPYYKTVNYGSDVVIVDGEELAPNALSINDFIRNWEPSWLIYLYEYHPESCFADWCDDNLDTEDFNGETSFSYNDDLQGITTMDDLLIKLGMPESTLTTSNPETAFKELFNELAEQDPFFTVTGIAASDFYTRFTVTSADQTDDIPGIIQSFLSRDFSPTGTWSWSGAPDYQKNLAWTTLRGLYLGRKGVFVEKEQLAHCEQAGNNGVHGTKWHCLIQPMCEGDNSPLPCTPSGTCTDAAFTEYEARWMHTTRIAYLDQPNLLVSDYDDMLATGVVAAEQNCIDLCAGYRTAWAAELADCPIYANNLNAILNRFEAICATGCSDGRYWGTSTVPENQNQPGGFSSFQEVLEFYQGAVCMEEACNTSLINFPPPAPTNPPYPLAQLENEYLYTGHLVLTIAQLPIWATQNRAQLEARLAEICLNCVPNQQDLTGDQETSNRSSSIDPTICLTLNQDRAETIATLNGIATEDVIRAFNVLRKFLEEDMIDSEETQDLIIPAEFNVTGNFCVNKGYLGILSTDFSNQNLCADLSPEELQAMRAEFFNASLGWNRTAEEYDLVLAYNDPTLEETCFICANARTPTSTPIGTHEEELADCNAEQMAQLELEAAYAYEIYRNTQLDIYEQGYRAFCLGAVEERMEMRYKLKEYHYTLYYYDQSGNLAMTVPPEGVHYYESQSDISDDAAVFRAGLVDSEAYGGTMPSQELMPQDLVPPHKMATHYLYNSFNEVRITDRPDQFPSHAWYDPQGRIVLSEDGRQDEQNLLSYTLYDNLGRTIEVGEFALSNSALNRSQLIFNARKGMLAMDVEELLGRRSVTRTFYTESPFTVTEPDGTPLITNASEASRNRVLATTFQDMVAAADAVDAYDFASHYDYDIAGNVKTLVQDFPDLSPGHRFKKLDYDYDLISGNVNYLFYQAGKEDNFSYHYKYDRLNRLTDVFTSEQDYDVVSDMDPATSATWKRDAAYSYYDHGPLRRTVLGQDRLQGLDYAYTIHGWIKGVNGSLGNDFDCITPPDMGEDGNGGPQATNYPDLYRYSNQYFDQDYLPINREVTGNPHYSHLPATGEDNYQLFNGNIFRHFKVTATDQFRTVALVGLYDQLNRLTWSGNNFYDEGYTSPEPYVNNVREKMVYDGNGNIESLERSFQAMDPTSGEYGGTNILTYNYGNDVGEGEDRESNRLLGVSVSTVREGTPSFQPVPFLEHDFAYTYDGTGNITNSTYGQQSTVYEWNPYGKVKQAYQEVPTQSTYQRTTFGYGPDQNRWSKSRADDTAPNGTVTDYYVRDAQGNTLATYTRNVAADGPLFWQSQYLFGSSRLGAVALDRQLSAGNTGGPVNNAGARRYELTNHLGNVPITFSENIVDYTDDSGTFLYSAPEILSHQDYTAFGLEWHRNPGLAGEDRYRFGFNGKEQDHDNEWSDFTHYDYGFRIYNPAVAKFLSLDPLAANYPWYTPYQFAGNTPIQAIDLDGLEELRVTELIEKGFEVELKILREDEVLSTYLSKISKDELVDKHLVIFRFNPKARQAYTTFRRLDEKHEEFFNYFKQYPDAVTPEDQNIMDEMVKEFSEISGLSIEEVRSEIDRGRTIHVVAFNPIQINTKLDYSLNNFLHEIEFHLIGNIQGKIRTEANQDHKEAFLYDLLSDGLKALIDKKMSPDEQQLPKESMGYKLYQIIVERLKVGDYKKDVSDEANKKRLDFYKENRDENNE